MSTSLKSEKLQRQVSFCRNVLLKNRTYKELDKANPPTHIAEKLQPLISAFFDRPTIYEFDDGWSAEWIYVEPASRDIVAIGVTAMADKRMSFWFWRDGELVPVRENSFITIAKPIAISCHCLGDFALERDLNWSPSFNQYD